MTALHVATEKGFPNIVQLLLELSANINAQDENGYTPLHIAMIEENQFSGNGLSKIVSMLLEKGYYYCYYYYFNTLGSNVKLEDKYGCTPLDVAARHGQSQYFELL